MHCEGKNKNGNKCKNKTYNGKYCHLHKSQISGDMWGVISDYTDIFPKNISKNIYKKVSIRKKYLTDKVVTAFQKLLYKYIGVKGKFWTDIFRSGLIVSVYEGIVLLHDSGITVQDFNEYIDPKKPIKKWDDVDDYFIYFTDSEKERIIIGFISPYKLRKFIEISYINMKYACKIINKYKGKLKYINNIDNKKYKNLYSDMFIEIIPLYEYEDKDEMKEALKEMIGKYKYRFK